MPHPYRIRRRGAAFLVALSLLLALPRTPSMAADARLVTLDAEDAYLPSLLKILAEKGGLNIITGPDVTGVRLSIHIKDVPVDQAVNLVVRAAGLAYERIGNSILVADAKSLKDETGLSSYVVDLKFADAEEVRAALAKLSADIEIDRGGNRLIVVTSPRVIAEIQEIVRLLDVPARQVMLEARVVEVGTDDAKKLGVDWDLLSRQSFLIVEGTPDSSGSIRDDLFIPSTPGKNDLFDLRRFSRQAKAFQIAIDMLIREGSARVLASPKIATLNGREASMLIGNRIPYTVTGTVFAGGGASPTERVEKEEVGVKLNITPLINADGYITTIIRPEVSAVTGFTGINRDLPIVSTRQASTTVRLKDGNSVIIGGLLSEERVTTITKVPILGSVPVLGLLFQHHDSQVRKRDLIIEVTPRIMPDQQ